MARRPACPPPRPPLNERPWLRHAIRVRQGAAFSPVDAHAAFDAMLVDDDGLLESSQPTAGGGGGGGGDGSGGFGPVGRAWLAALEELCHLAASAPSACGVTAPQLCSLLSILGETRASEPDDGSACHSPVQFVDVCLPMLACRDSAVRAPVLRMVDEVGGAALNPTGPLCVSLTPCITHPTAATPDPPSDPPLATRVALRWSMRRGSTCHASCASYWSSRSTC